jgi:hypothetical protein
MNNFNIMIGSYLSVTVLECTNLKQGIFDIFNIFIMTIL